MVSTLKIEKIAINDLIPYENNAKLHPREQIEQIKASIREFGFNDPLAIGENNVIIEGHGRWMALKELGYDEVEVIRLDHLTDEQRRAYTLVHNKLTMDTGFDLDILNEELSKIEDIDMSIYDFELDDEVIDDDEPAEEDNWSEELPEEITVKLGDVYQLGEHRLMCGDSTSREDVLKLMDGVKADLLITDPPYNVDYTGGTEEKLKIKNDNMPREEFKAFLTAAFANAYEAMQSKCAFYVWYAMKEVVAFVTSLEDSGFTVKQELIWNKNALVMGRQDYQWKHEDCLYGWKEAHEPCFYGWKTNNVHDWYSDRKQTTVIDWDKPLRNDIHPTMKPVGLFDYQIRNNTKKGDVVLDLFAGSGTTLIACEQNGRVSYSMEYDPRYAQAIIGRWEQLTGQNAVKLNEGKEAKC